jgi:glycopeptide antibiotics resistance protein
MIKNIRDFKKSLLIKFFSYGYVSLLLYLVFFDYKRFIINYNHAVNFIPFQKAVFFFKQNHPIYTRIQFEFYLDLIGNLLLFIPFAIAWQSIGNKMYSNSIFIVQIFCFSFSIELIQYCFSIGVADIDDVILNTLGGVIGVLFLRILEVYFGGGSRLRSN